MSKKAIKNYIWNVSQRNSYGNYLIWHCQNNWYGQKKETDQVNGLPEVEDLCCHVGQETVQIFKGSSLINQDKEGSIYC